MSRAESGGARAPSAPCIIQVYTVVVLWNMICMTIIRDTIAHAFINDNYIIARPGIYYLIPLHVANGQKVGKWMVLLYHRL